MLLWSVSAIWLAALVFTAWRLWSNRSRINLIAYVAVGVAGLIPYLWLLVSDQLPAGYRTAMTTVWVLVAVASVVGATQQQKRKLGGR